MTILKYYQTVKNLPIRESHKISNLKFISNKICDVQIEQCFYIDVGENKNLTIDELEKIEWLLTNPLDHTGLSQNTFLSEKINCILVEIGPR